MVELAKEDAELQKRSLERVKSVYDKGASTDTALDDARKQELASRNSLQSMQNQLKMHEQRKKTLTVSRKLAAAQLKRAATDLKRTKVSAPVSGTIVSTSVEQGDYVKVGDPLFKVNDTDDMEVSCQFRVDELYWLWLQAGTFDVKEGASADTTFEIPNTPVEIAFEFKGVEYLWDGVLFRYDGTGLDPSTRTIPCRVLVKEPTEVRVAGEGVRGLVAPPTLFSGMYVKVRVPIRPPIPLVAVPNTAVQPGGETWVVRDGALDIEKINVARMAGDTALLAPSPNGPQPGEPVVTSPLAGPAQGMEVQAISSNSPLERAMAEGAADSAPTQPPTGAGR